MLMLSLRITIRNHSQALLCIYALELNGLVSRAFDVDLLHIAEHFSIPVSEIAVNWHEIPGLYSPLLLAIFFSTSYYMISRGLYLL